METGPTSAFLTQTVGGFEPYCGFLNGLFQAKLWMVTGVLQGKGAPALSLTLSLLRSPSLSLSLALPLSLPLSLSLSLSALSEH